MSEIRFTVYGVAQPKGSARAFIPRGWKRPIVTTANPSLKSWEALVRSELQRVMSTGVSPASSLFDAPIIVRFAFCFPRPKSVPRSRLWPTKRPDLDKCVRSTIDALSGVAFRDDTQVVRIEARKHYATGPACVHITIAEAIHVDPAFAEYDTARTESQV